MLWHEEQALKREQRKAWLASLKDGDEVAIDGNSRYGHPPTILAIRRLTATQFVVATKNSGREERYRREDGCKVGGRYSGEIVPVTPELLGKIELHGHREWLNSLAWRGDRIDAIPAPVIAAMRAAYDKAMAELQNAATAAEGQ